MLVFLVVLVSGALLISKREDAGTWALLLFPTGIGLAWLTWSIAATKWRIWAFTNVRNVHELKRKGVHGKLIWPDGSIFGKTEIKTSRQRRKLSELDQKFLLPDIFHDDASIPLETVIRFSKRSKVISMCIGIVLIGVGLYFVFAEGQYIMAAMFFAGDYLAIKSYRQMRNREPLLTLNDKGMRIKDGPLMDWHFISRIEIWQNLLKYTVSDLSDHVLKLDEMELSPGEIERRIETYLGRYEWGKQPNGV